MAVDAATMPTIPTSAPATNNSSGSNSGNSNSSSTGIADNFQSFLMLLTTQLQNQNPLDPLDTNQFTQQLVQFAQVEQQLKSNSQLESLVKIEQSAQSTQALVFVGQTVAVDGSTAHFDGNATWNFNAPQNSSATITITNSAGQTAYTGSFAIGSGNSSFVWDGKGNDGTKWPVGDYKMTVTAKDAGGKDVAISTEVQGTVDSVDLTASPALLSIGGKNYTVDQIKRVVKQAASS
ncbi:MAG: flagellar basal-body rod modification protein FlgD [Afipia broomeae]|jgi:flagellar basal-body rod modification protein FlgD|nr:MAG: flagellar biosynthesis protein FlgD [Bradyrhizobiaceae bacterium]